MPDLHELEDRVESDPEEVATHREYLLDVATTEDQKEQERAINILVALATADPEFVRPLVGECIELFDSEEKMAVLRAGNVLAALSTNPSNPVEDVVPSLIKALTESEASRRKGAAYALDEVAKERPTAIRRAVDGLLNSLEDEDEMTRHNAASALRRLSTVESHELRTGVPELAETLDDPNEKTRNFAAQALMEVSKEYPWAIRPAVDGLRDALSDDNEYTRHFSACALKELSKAEPTSLECAVAELVDAFDDTNEKTRNFAVFAVSELAKEQPTAIKSNVEALAGLLDDPNDYTRNYAAFALRKIAGASPEKLSPALPALGSVIKDPIESTQQHVAVTLERISEHDPESITEVCDEIVAVIANAGGERRLHLATAIENVAEAEPASVSHLARDLIDGLRGSDQGNVALDADRRVLAAIREITKTAPEAIESAVPMIESYAQCDQDELRPIALEILEKASQETAANVSIDVKAMRAKSNGEPDLQSEIATVKDADRSPRGLELRVEALESALDDPDAAAECHLEIADIVVSEVEHTYSVVERQTRISDLSKRVIRAGIRALEAVAEERDTLEPPAQSAILTALESDPDPATRQRAARTFFLSEPDPDHHPDVEQRLVGIIDTGPLEAKFWIALAIVEVSSSVDEMPIEVFETLEEYITTATTDFEERVSALRMFYATIFTEDNDEVVDHLSTVLSPLEYALRNGEKEARLTAVALATNVGVSSSAFRQSVVTLLREALSDDNNTVALYAVRALEQIGVVLSSKAVTELNPGARGLVSALGMIGPRSRRSRLNPQRRFVSDLLIPALSNQRWEGMELVDALVEAIDDHRAVSFIEDRNREKISRNAASALVEVARETPATRQQVFVGLVRSLNAADDNTRNRAVDTLGRMAIAFPEFTTPIVAVLTSAYPDDEPMVSRHMITALEDVYKKISDPPPEILHFFQHVVKHGQDQTTNNAAGALGRLAGERHFEPNQAIELFAGRLDDDPEAACLGLSALGETSDAVLDDLVEVLETALRSNYRPKYPAAALGKLGGRYDQIRPGIVATFDSVFREQDPDVLDYRQSRREAAALQGVVELCMETSEPSSNVLAPVESALDRGSDRAKEKAITVVRTICDETAVSDEAVRPLLESAVESSEHENYTVDAAIILARQLSPSEGSYSAVVERLDELLTGSDGLSLTRDRYGRACDAVRELATQSERDVPHLIRLLRDAVMSGDIVIGSLVHGNYSSRCPSIRALREIGLERPEYSREVLDALERALEKDSTVGKTEVVKAVGMVGIKSKASRERAIDLLADQTTAFDTNVQNETLRMLRKTFTVNTAKNDTRARITGIFCDRVVDSPAEVTRKALHGLIKASKLSPDLVADHVSSILMRIPELDGETRSSAITVVFASIIRSDGLVDVQEGSQVLRHLLVKEDLSQSRVTAGLDCLARDRSVSKIHAVDVTH